MRGFDPTGTYVYFAENGDCEQVEVSESFWPDVASGERGVWHTARHAKGCRALFVTWGEGTESVPL